MTSSREREDLPHLEIALAAAADKSKVRRTCGTVLVGRAETRITHGRVTLTDGADLGVPTPFSVLLTTTSTPPPYCSLVGEQEGTRENPETFAEHGRRQPGTVQGTTIESNPIQSNPPCLVCFFLLTFLFVQFGFYVMFPIGSMYYFGSPDFFEHYVKNLKFWPEESKTNRPPVEKEDIRAALEELRRDRLARKAAREEGVSGTRRGG